MKPAAVYLRVSTNRQNPENQAPDCRKLCVSLGWAPKVFSEQASGTKDRAVWSEIMRRALRGEFCGVVVWSIDRMGRNFFDIQDAMRKLGDAGIPVASARESWVLELSESEPLRALLVAIMGFVADVERRRTMDRIQAGLATARRQIISYNLLMSPDPTD